MSHSEFHTAAEYQAALDQLMAEAHLRMRFYDTTLEKGGL